MAKQKNPTPQELYRARKEREEQEKSALLPPGLYNHGNTCFMNSVLQGLIATPLLHDMALSSPTLQSHQSSHISLRRSPQLTNGHGLGGDFEKPWVEGMPLGDIFFSLMMKAWGIQQNRRRENLSPKEVLTTIGKKYDQYLDFAQQDAHEFLRQLLDAMHMEEQDVIKKRQPQSLLVKWRKRRRTTITPSSAENTLPGTQREEMKQTPPPVSDDDKLMSVSDMIFGGKLTSILVCQSCKHISQTYEDFNDLSLSIKPEDYVRERKRDRLKNFAKKLTTSATTALTVGLEMHRSSSLPPSPREREGGHLVGTDEPPIIVDSRRRSLDVVADPVQSSSESPSHSDASELADTVPANTNSFGNKSTNDRKHTETADTSKPEKSKKGREADTWVKIGRRISMTVGLGKSKDRNSRPKERKELILEEDGGTISKSEGSTSSETTTSSMNSSTTAQTSISEEAITKDGGPEIRILRPSMSSEPPSSTEDSRPPSRSSPLTLSPASSTTSLHRLSYKHRSIAKHAKSPRPPKPSLAELQYLRQVLADVNPTSNRFTLLKPHPQGNNLLSTPAQSMWMKMGQPLPSVEECLRLFTAVEILGGENMVGCTRCWKIQHGVYHPGPPEERQDDNSDSDDQEELPTPPDLLHIQSSKRWTTGSQISLSTPPIPTRPILTSLSSPSLSVDPQQDLSDRGSVSSLPISRPYTYTAKHVPSPPAPSHSSTHGELPILSISTAGPDPPEASPSTARASAFAELRLEVERNSSDQNSVQSSLETSSLTAIDTTGTGISSPTRSDMTPTPTTNYLHAPQLRTRRPTSDLDITDYGSEGEESDASATSAFSGVSSTSSTSPEISQLPAHADNKTQPSASAPGLQKKPSRHKPVIMRAAYKRYLIASPPPILVIHLKRFQQVARTQIMSFSHGFKKLDDYVAFPEFLDLTPFLAPRKEDFGLGPAGTDPSSPMKKVEVKHQQCLYRLYAVVVHIGNMLGGHYIAYTALPATNSPPSATSSSGNNQAETSTTKRQWAYISDTTVRLVTLEEVLKAKAYICMYERL